MRLDFIQKGDGSPDIKMKSGGNQVRGFWKLSRGSGGDERKLISSDKQIGTMGQLLVLDSLVWLHAVGDPS